ncbi:uncharacterized protein LOC131860401 [Cryptomeria japonica]|uniref:uncharacterized protein LOC131860401 n=1 Tax=Cryptomeria japonica TaxID=3369 RepID=UPI0027DA924E|nr:uncharacterized protein LOC131860401 [Cryptomeria japonica]
MALPLQQRTRHVHLHKYALHLIKYYDQKFGQHVRFRYYIYNLMMRHRSQQSVAMCIKTNLEDSLPHNLHGLKEYLQNKPSNELPNHIMRYAASLRGTRAFWSKSRRDLTTMIEQLGAPTLFFTLSSTDTKWPDLHKLLPKKMSTTVHNNRRQFIENLVNNPHITALYLHLRFQIFHDEVIVKQLKAIDHWYRYEWQHRGSAHIHGFLWLPEAPNIDNLDWSDHASIQSIKHLFDQYITTWNPPTKEARLNKQYMPAISDPCLADTEIISRSDPSIDYTKLLNVVQRHTKCSEYTCLKKKNSTLECRYKVP